MPLIDFTNPFYSVSTLVLFVLCVIINKNNKSNTIPCIMLLSFLAILVGHTIELANAVTSEQIVTIAVCVLIDEAYTFASFLSFLWMDKVQAEQKAKSKKKSKKLENKTIEDGLDFLWKKV